MILKKIVPIIGFAHDLATPGKRSPDGIHREAVWSRERGNNIALILRASGFDVHFSNPGNVDLKQGRIKNIDAVKVAPGQVKLYVSLHNNAAGDGSQWLNASGVEIWTKQGNDYADTFADLFFRVFMARFPELKFRKNSSTPGAQDKEGNLYEVKSTTAYSVLVEWLFQDNKEDYKKLLDPKYNKAFEDSIVDMIEMCEMWCQKNIK